MLIALLAASSGPLAPIDYGGVQIKIFHDTATSALFLTMFLLLLFTRRKWTIGHVILLSISAVVVILCFRRSVWFAAIVTAALVVMLARGGRGLRRFLFIAIPVSAVGVLLVPGVLDDVWQQAGQVFEAISSAPAEQTSAGLHVSDLEVGWAAALASPLMGVGIFSSQVGGFAAGGTSLYVHNEFLQVWLRWGLLGLVLFTILLVIAVVAGFRVVRSRLAPDAVRAAGFFLAILPVPVITAPFVSMTARWSTLVGIAAGLCIAWLRRERETFPAVTKVSEIRVTSRVASAASRRMVFRSAEGRGRLS
ncbi:O-antigen ligase [Microbacterium sp. SORGH_AS_0888]|uniref:O-antigen ligase family protein n=1 Tax=Microbacterium sp. SORGH_AS_0888 TaxID=3041791 RepID=UPI00277D51BE|nr:O-antigen ligase family protein [Microbacterium sp. SORGH_AS_0888]MDQ1130450.1 O-antigen ligase [Microbacterium sp. SORGH_AS_0888]